MSAVSTPPISVLGRVSRTVRRVRPSILFPIVLLATWQLLVVILPTDVLPVVPSEVFRFMWSELRGDTVAYDSVYVNFAITLGRLLVGIVATLFIGSIVGILAGRSRYVDTMSRDFVVATISVPGLVFALIAAMWFGFSFWTPVITLVLATSPYVVVNMAEGVRNAPRDLLEMGDAFRMPRHIVIRHIVIPALMPFFFVSIRYSLSLGWKALTIAELFGADDGAGWMLRFWYDAGRINSLVGYALFFVVVSILIDRVLLVWLSGRIYRWRHAPSLAH